MNKVTKSELQRISINLNSYINRIYMNYSEPNYDKLWSALKEAKNCTDICLSEMK